MAKGGNSGGEDDDDLSLWQRIAGSATPLKKRDRVRLPEIKPAKAAPKPLVPAKPPVALPPRKSPSPSAKQLPQRRPEAVSLERREMRALEKGRVAVEARLDLHGMRQRQAHAALRRFLREAQARGLRHVLVITGKGTPKTSSENFYTEEPRGVLKQSVPGWLAQPDLADVVISFSEAPRRLGGEGALYVRLKRGRG
ncbi:Smr/MutS family protein [Methyloligella sp. 2.7D]|uniref:Smr/MutS family protein n=1 Tax=unclassified Methyloligella TaxID=2625955 RepID=UPI00157DD9BF|nr:Smr/MutS family protein [Methyloligella sp. GL2]QKP76282.1 Smr/MutS family protein [Methyloligella sp. GL2]